VAPPAWDRACERAPSVEAVVMVSLLSGHARLTVK
jgi:hypothetical protein